MSKQRKTLFDDGFQDYLVKGATFEGRDGIPRMLDLKNTEIPKKLILFTAAKHCKDKSGYVIFYQHDNFLIKYLREQKITYHFLISLME